MNTTHIVKDGKLYLLLFDEYAEFLVDKTNYDVYMISYDKPMIKVTKDNFQKLRENVKTFEEKRTWGDCFVMELELPPMKVEIITDRNPSITFNSPYNTGFQGFVLDSPDVWINKEVEKEWSKNTKVDFIQLRDELKEKVEKFNKGVL
jgi:hypothetical protein